MQLLERLETASNYLLSQSPVRPKLGIILGSSLGSFADELEDQVALEYSQVPHFVTSTVDGHSGKLVLGRMAQRDLIVMQGRFHAYEGYDLEQVTFPVRVMKQLGVEELIVTNAAGGINLSFQTGALMLITDHINLTGRNPLVGLNYDALGPRFPDMSEVYNLELRNKASRVAAKANLKLEEGIYAGLLGPSYETPAEIRMLRTLGADAVGMSTVPEAIIARHCGINVLGISCITNMAAGVLPQPLDHSEVMETAMRVKDQFIELLKGIVGLES